jgi:hypothetical protein
MTEVAWLIEFKQSVSQQPAWYGADDTEGLGMVTDVNQAIRFSRKWDAEQVITEIGWTEARAVEHAWVDTHGWSERYGELWRVVNNWCDLQIAHPGCLPDVKALKSALEKRLP